jgi:RNA polymerase sigma-70 factor (ECF subfamily)
MVETQVASVEAAMSFDAFFRKEFARVARAAAVVACDRTTGPDLAQEAFARLFSRWSEMTSEEHARNFVYRVAMNLAKSHRRRILRPIWSLGSTGDVTPDHSEVSAAWVSVVEALRRLSPRQRQAVVLIDYADLSSATVGELMGMKDSTVRVHLMRGREALRASLGIDQEGTR